MIRENLSGKRIAITGSTGFLGTALVERFLRSVPDCELVLLVRPGRRGAEHRVKRDILKNDAFDRLRDAFKEDPIAEFLQAVEFLELKPVNDEAVDKASQNAIPY